VIDHNNRAFGFIPKTSKRFLLRLKDLCFGLTGQPIKTQGRLLPWFLIKPLLYLLDKNTEDTSITSCIFSGDVRLPLVIQSNPMFFEANKYAFTEFSANRCKYFLCR